MANSFQIPNLPGFSYGAPVGDGSPEKPTQPASAGDVKGLQARKARLEQRLAQAVERAQARGKPLSQSMAKWVKEAQLEVARIDEKLAGAGSAGGGYVQGPNPAQALAGMLGPQSQFRPGYAPGSSAGAATADAKWHQETAGIFESVPIRSISIGDLRKRLMG